MQSLSCPSLLVQGFAAALLQLEGFGAALVSKQTKEALAVEQLPQLTTSCERVLGTFTIGVMCCF